MSHSINNNYYIVPVADIAIYSSYIEQDVVNLRKNIAGDEYVVKLPFNQVNIPQVFTPLTHYNHSEILVEMAKAAWATPDVI